MGCAHSTSAQDPSTEVDPTKVQTDETLAAEETKAVVIEDETKPVEAAEELKAEEPKAEEVAKDESTVEKLTVEELGTEERKTEAVVKDEELTMEDFKVEEVVAKEDEIIDGREEPKP